MRENEFWRTLVKPNLSPFGVLHRIENTVELGTPDVTYTLRHPGSNMAVSGWIELKAARLPKWNDTILRFKRFTVDQAEWLAEQSRIGGKACLLTVLDGRVVSLIPGQDAPEVQDGVPLSRFRALSTVWGDRSFPAGRILKWLTE